jgi:AraC-like DNA-binding protein
MAPIGLALQRFPLIETRSLDEAVSLQSRLNTPVRVQWLDTRVPFEWRANRVVMGSLGIMANQYRAGVRGQTDNVESLYSLMVPLRSGGQVRQTAQPVDLIPGRTAALLSPALPADILLRNGYRGIQVAIPSQVLEGTLDALTGGAIRKNPLRFEHQVDIASGHGASFLRLLDFILAEADREDGVLPAPLVQDKLADAFVCSLLLGQPHNYSPLLRLPVASVEPACVRRVEEYIAANAHRQLTVVDLASVAGVSARTLFAAFRAHRGGSPMAFLRTRRFELARTRLLSGAASSVADVALGCGFEHLGRFSVGYRARFGESPAHTLRRSRTRAPG